MALHPRLACMGVKCVKSLAGDNACGRWHTMQQARVPYWQYEAHDASIENSRTIVKELFMSLMNRAWEFGYIAAGRRRTSSLSMNFSVRPLAEM